MDILALRTFFFWVTIFNAILLFITMAIYTRGGNWVYSVHGRLYPMTRETFNVAIYCFVGAMKLIVLMFNLVPYLALLIITRG